MLTPDKIKSKTFQTTATGSYRSEDVNNFFEEVSVSYEQLFRENGSLIKKLSLLANKVEEYKKDEDSLRHALLAAQKLADQIVAEAKETSETSIRQANAEAADIVSKAEGEAEKILNDAKTASAKLVNDARYTAEATIHNANVQADELLGGINRKATQEKLIYDMLQKEVSDFRAKLMTLYEEHLLLLDKIPSIVKESQEKVENKAVVEVTPETVEENIISEADELAEVEAIDNEPSDKEEEAYQQEEEVEEAFELTDFNFEDETEIDVETDAEAEIKANSDEDGFSLSFDIDESDDIEDSDFSAGDSFTFTAVDEEVDDIDDIELLDSFSDVEKEPVKDGFSLDISDLDLEDEPEEDTSSEVQDIKSKYAALDEDFDDEEDDGAISFKKFFRKK